MSLESQIDEIQSQIEHIETILEEALPQMMTMQAAIALSGGNKAQALLWERTFVVYATGGGYNAWIIEQGEVKDNRVGVSDQGLEQFLGVGSSPNEKIWISI
jgi:hypothetical protein